MEVKDTNETQQWTAVKRELLCHPASIRVTTGHPKNEYLVRVLNSHVRGTDPGRHYDQCDHSTNLPMAAHVEDNLQTTSTSRISRMSCSLSMANIPKCSIMHMYLQYKFLW